jgi:pimeloyl-ACP methyl ester carboxylesterase
MSAADLAQAGSLGARPASAKAMARPRAGRLEVISKGPTGPHRGPPLLFVHGSWHAAWCWDEGFLDYFASRGFEVHALSLRGHGGSDGHQRLRSTRIRDYVDDIAEVSAGLRQAPILVGHSMGGFLVQKYLETRDAPAAVLMASMPYYGVAPTVLRFLQKDPLGVLLCNATLRLKHLVSTPEKVRRLFFSDRVPERDVRVYASRMQDEAFLGYIDMMFRNLCKPSRVRTPVLVLEAGCDQIFTSKQTRSVAEAYGTVPVRFREFGHDMMLEPGWEVVADTMMDWLQAF